MKQIWISCTRRLSCEWIDLYKIYSTLLNRCVFLAGHRSKRLHLWSIQDIRNLQVRLYQISRTGNPTKRDPKKKKKFNHWTCELHTGVYRIPDTSILKVNKNYWIMWSWLHRRCRLIFPAVQKMKHRLGLHTKRVLVWWAVCATSSKIHSHFFLPSHQKVPR